jgi:hypothetical protein
MRDQIEVKFFKHPVMRIQCQGRFKSSRAFISWQHSLNWGRLWFHFLPNKRNLAGDDVWNTPTDHLVLCVILRCEPEQKCACKVESKYILHASSLCSFNAYKIRMLPTLVAVQIVTKQNDVVAMFKNCTGDVFGSNLGWYIGYRDWGFPNSLSEVRI